MFNHINNWKVFLTCALITAIGLVIFKRADVWYMEILGVYITYTAITYDQHSNPVISK